MGRVRSPPPHPISNFKASSSGKNLLDHCFRALWRHFNPFGTTNVKKAKLYNQLITKAPFSVQH